MIDYIAIFEKLRFYPENEVVELKKAENSSDFDDFESINN